MSGVTGAERVRSRADFAKFIEEYREIIENFPGYISLNVSGSYNADLTKETFGDIDLIIHVGNCVDKRLIKQLMVRYFETLPNDVIVPFTSEKHSGKRTSNTGELVSVRFHSKTLGYSVQIDNIVAVSAKEADFKLQFLNLPAEKQGLILGLVKVSAIENVPRSLFELLGLKDMISYPSKMLDAEWEFSLSSSKLELRIVHYARATTEQVQHDIYWTSQDWNDVKKILWQYDLDNSFDQLLLSARDTIVNPRSAKRIMGLFKSMVTVKSGEVGTPKGVNKEKALSKVILCLAL